MNKRFGECRFWTTYVEDKRDGFAGLRLHCEVFGKTKVAAECIYWDAVGGYSFKTIEGDVPIQIVAKLIAETQERIGVR